MHEEFVTPTRVVEGEPIVVEYIDNAGFDDAYIWDSDPFQHTEPEARWICAIMKVDRSSVPLWDRYAKELGEEVMYKLVREKGQVRLDVLFYTHRAVADVVTSAWVRYNGQL